MSRELSTIFLANAYLPYLMMLSALNNLPIVKVIVY
jgi:hypothetical protein